MTCEINSTVITENKKAIQTIYKMLWDIIALYEPTDAYNSLPNSDDNTDCRDYMDAQILNVRKELSSLFINDQHLIQMLEQIINETEIFVKSYELPGVAMRWKKINKALIFFDCAFDILNDEPEFYNEICLGITDIKLSCYPNKELITARKKYFEYWEQKCKSENLQYSQKRLFQNELHKTLYLVFRNDFMNYLTL